MNIHIPPNFTLSELKSFIEGQETAEPPEGYYSAQEWAEHFCISVPKMRKILGRAKDKGLLDKTSVRREALDGKGCRVPIYALRMKEENVST